MANDYLMEWSGGFKPPFTLPGETIDTSSTSLTLVGRGTNLWGESVQENFLRLLENFASSTAPTHPTTGQVWYDYIAGNLPASRLKVFNGVTWVLMFDDSIVTSSIAALNAAIASINTVPTGGIIMWSGITIPTPGWALCDGTLGTPDLRNKFIMGSGGTYPTNANGGSSTITANNLPNHAHTFSGTANSAGTHGHAVNDPTHAHSITGFVGASGAIHLAYDTGAPVQSTIATTNNYTGITIAAAGDHVHTFSGTTVSGGGGSNDDFIPPFYALAYIMRL